MRYTRFLQYDLKNKVHCLSNNMDHLNRDCGLPARVLELGCIVYIYSYYSYKWSRISLCMHRIIRMDQNRGNPEEENGYL